MTLLKTSITHLLSLTLVLLCAACASNHSTTNGHVGPSPEISNRTSQQATTSPKQNNAPSQSKPTTQNEGLALSKSTSKTTDETSQAQEVLMHALSLTGIKYKYGGTSPKTGFDCSGFVGYVFRHAANINLPRTSRAISLVGQKISTDKMQAGDLVFFKTSKLYFSHVGIYMGNNKFIHAPSSGKKVRVEDMQKRYWKKRFNGARRITKKQ